MKYPDLRSNRIIPLVQNTLTSLCFHSSFIISIYEPLIEAKLINSIEVNFLVLSKLNDNHLCHHNN